MLGLHELNAALVIAVNLLAFGWGGIYMLRKRYPGRLYAHALALGQSLLIAQVALGLVLLSDGRRAPDKLHYAYGTFALLAVLVVGNTAEFDKPLASLGTVSNVDITIPPPPGGPEAPPTK